MLTTPHPESQDGRQRPDLMAFGEFRRDLRQVLFEHGTASNLGWTESNIVESFRKLLLEYKATAENTYMLLKKERNAHAALSERVRELEERNLGLSVENSGLCDALDQCFVHLSDEIIRLPLDDSADCGAQKLAGLIAGLLDEHKALTAQRSEP